MSRSKRPHWKSDSCFRVIPLNLQGMAKAGISRKQTGASANSKHATVTVQPKSTNWHAQPPEAWSETVALYHSPCHLANKL